MPLNLVNYSDSSSDEEKEEPKNEQIVEKSAKSKLPNPFEKPRNSDEVEEDAEEHDGRTRLFPHERGNWPTYVYIHCDKTDLITRLQNELLNLLKSTSSLETVQFHPLEELHMSLTRTVVLRHHWIDEFVRSIESSLKNQNRFWLQLNSIQIYCNDNQSRTFLSLSLSDMTPISMTTQHLRSIVQRLDNCLKDFKLPTFYKEASFHVSLLWCLGDRRNELQSLLPQFYSIFENISSTNDSHFILNVERLYCKIGNKLYSFHL